MFDGTREFTCCFPPLFFFFLHSPLPFVSSSTRGRGKLCVSVPSCALWCRLKTWWESSAYRSKCPSPTKVLLRHVGSNRTGQQTAHLFARVEAKACFPLPSSQSLSDGSVTEPDMSACFCPDHKAPMVLFLDRVYGIEDQSFLLHLLEVGFLPDLRAATSLDTVGEADVLRGRT